MGCGLTSVLLCAEDLWKTMSPSLDFSTLGLATSRYGLRTNSSPHSLANVQLQLDIRRNQATFVPELEKSRQIKSKRRPFQMHVFIQSFQNLFTHCGKGLTSPLDAASFCTWLAQASVTPHLHKMQSSSPGRPSPACCRSCTACN